MVIFHSYVSLPEGIQMGKERGMHQSCPEVQESTRHWLMEIHGRTSFCAYQHALWLHLQYKYVCRYASIRELFHVLYPVPSCSISMEQCSKTCLSGASIGFRKLIIAWWVCPKIWCISKWPIQLWKIRGKSQTATGGMPAEVCWSAFIGEHIVKFSRLCEKIPIYNSY